MQLITLYLEDTSIQIKIVVP